MGTTTTAEVISPRPTQSTLTLPSLMRKRTLIPTLTMETTATPPPPRPSAPPGGGRRTAPASPPRCTALFAARSSPIRRRCMATCGATPIARGGVSHRRRNGRRERRRWRRRWRRCRAGRVQGRSDTCVPGVGELSTPGKPWGGTGPVIEASGDAMQNPSTKVGMRVETTG